MQVLQEELGTEDEAVFQAASGLGGGVGGSQSICGAITGSALAIGSLYGKRGLDRPARRQQVRPRVGALCADFRKQFGALDCRLLTECDFNDEAAHQRFLDSGQREARCLKYVSWAVQSALERLQSEVAG